jgi:S1-C subfamily serine protease
MKPEDEGKLVVGRILADSPAATGGLQAGDQILKLDTKAVKNLDEISKIMEQKAAGSKLKMEFRRNGETKTIEIELKEEF